MSVLLEVGSQHLEQSLVLLWKYLFNKITVIRRNDHTHLLSFLPAKSRFYIILFFYVFSYLFLTLRMLKACDSPPPTIISICVMVILYANHSSFLYFSTHSSLFFFFLLSVYHLSSLSILSLGLPWWLSQ